jgi:hypothetical protein
VALLAETFQQIVDSLPDDWSDLEMDLRIFDEDRYIEAATFLVICQPQPYSKHDWHWKVRCAHRFGTAAAPSAVLTAFKLLDESRISGELALRTVRSGHVEVVPLWGRPESFKQELRRLRAQ